MIDAFGEGVAAIVLPCSWTLLLPALFCIVAADAGRKAVGALAAGLLMGLMVRAGGFSATGPAGNTMVGAAMGVAFLMLLRGARVEWASLLLGIVVTGLWQPCVGARLGSIFQLGVDEPVRAAFAMIPYALGVVLPVPAFGFVMELLRPERGDRLHVVASVGGVIGAVAIGVGLHTPVIGMLARWSVDLSM